MYYIPAILKSPQSKNSQIGGCPLHCPPFSQVRFGLPFKICPSWQVYSITDPCSNVFLADTTIIQNYGDNKYELGNFEKKMFYEYLLVLI